MRAKLYPPAMPRPAKSVVQTSCAVIVDVAVAVNVNVGGAVIVAVHVHGNAPVSVIDLRRNASNRVTYQPLHGRR